MSTNANKSNAPSIDWITLLLYFALVTIGIVSIYSSQYDQTDGGKIFNFKLFHGKQILLLGAALVLGFFILMMDARVFSSTAYFIYAFTLFLLFITIFLGHKENGAKGWLAFGGFQFQVSELGKYATALALAKFLSQYGFDINKLTNKVWAFAIILIPCLLIILQHDVGSALVFFSLIMVLYRQGLSPWYILIPLWFGLVTVLALYFGKVIVFVAAIIITIGINIIFRKSMRMIFIRFMACAITIAIAWGAEKSLSGLEGYQRTRIEVLLGKKLGSDKDNASNLDFATSSFTDKADSIDLKKAGWNVHQSLIAVGSGGLIGKGYLKGTQTKLGYVPAQSTDFIFCTIGEEAGFLGCLVVIGLCVAFLYRLIIIAERQKFVFNRCYAYGIVAILFFHLTINLATVLGLFPVVGIPLPFISYGGSSLIAFTVMVFTLLKLDAESRAL